MLEPYGMGNPEPVFAARGAQLAAPPRILKDKHVKLKLRAGAVRNNMAPSVKTLLAASPAAESGESPRPPSWQSQVAIPTAPQSGQKKRPLP